MTLLYSHLLSNIQFVCDVACLKSGAFIRKIAWFGHPLQIATFWQSGHDDIR